MTKEISYEAPRHAAVFLILYNYTFTSLALGKYNEGHRVNFAY